MAESRLIQTIIILRSCSRRQRGARDRLILLPHPATSRDTHGSYRRIESLLMCTNLLFVQCSSQGLIFGADFHFHMITESSRLHDCRVLLLDRGLNQCDCRNEIWIRTTFKLNKKCTDSFINELPPLSLRGLGCWLLPRDVNAL